MKTGGWINNELRPSNYRHGHAPAGKPTAEYRTWRSMIDRCHNPKISSFYRYGGRGVVVCDEWLKSFQRFLADMGPKPAGLTLDRKDNDGNYCKENCRWATRLTQSNNRSSNHNIAFAGKIQTLLQWSRETGIHYRTLSNRIAKGWPTERALTP